MIRQPDPVIFRTALQRIHRRFTVYAATSPQPLPAPGLVITPEIRLQSELYLPMQELRRLYYRLYQETLSYPPILSSTPFHGCHSWADCYVGLPDWLHLSPNPALLLERLLHDQQLLYRFIFHSFLPQRFNGAGFARYPEQLDWLRGWLPARAGKPLRILDAACGSGEGTWELVELLSDCGWKPEAVQIEGWTLEPLETLAAEQQYLPHLPERSRDYQKRVEPLLQDGWKRALQFKKMDLLSPDAQGTRFDLIICNGLLGGPIINNIKDLQQVIGNFSGIIASDGIVLVADRFHKGWKKQVTDQLLARLFADHNLMVVLTAAGA